MRKREYLVILAIIGIFLFVSCSKTDIVDDVESESGQLVEKDTHTTSIEEVTTEEVTTEEVTTEEVSTEEVTTTESDIRETATKEHIPEETTTKASSGNSNFNEYIYTRNYNDKKSVQILGDLDVSNEELAKIEELIKTYNRDMSFKVVSIDGSYGLSYNSDETYFSASSIKAPYLLYCHKSPNGTEYTLAEIMRLVVWCSDNSGYYMCTKRWGTDGYNALMNSIGCDSLKISNSYIWADKINAHDLITVWKNIYDYIESDAASSSHMYDICTDYKYNPLEDALPGYTIAQKYGTSTTKDVFCDGAIIYGKKNTYILAFFLDSTNDSKDKKFVTNLVKELNLIMDR